MTKRRLRQYAPEPEYSYRRRLSGTEWLPAIGIGVATGVVGFYLAKLLLQRTRLTPPPDRVAQIQRTPSMIYRRTRGAAGERLPLDES